MDTENISAVSLNDGILTLSTGATEVCVSDVASFTQAPYDCHGLSTPCTLVSYTLSGSDAVHTAELFPASPFIRWSAPENGEKMLFGAKSAHVRIHSVSFRDSSDHFDYLVKRDMEWLYPGQMELAGQIFLVENVPDGMTRIVISEHPSYAAASLSWQSSLQQAPQFTLHTEYPYSTAELPFEEAEEAIRRWYRRVYLGDRRRHSFVMSNTWGDRSTDTALCEKFVLKEIESAAKLGVDIMQLDDGWQKGFSVNSGIKRGVFSGFYDADPHFWEVNPTKFPNSLTPIAEKCRENGVTLGLWFAPDSANSFAEIDRDMETLSRLHQEFGAAYYKLDGCKFTDRKGEERFLKFLDSMSQVDGGALSFNLDITANHRLGHWFRREYGTLFVENRYTDTVRYYPFRTLRNLWMLSRFIPTVKFQMEVLNPRRNTALYGDDPLAPANYEMDYLFAAVMVSNPLIWLEMQNLNPHDAEALASIIADYRKYRDEMYPCDISPIGNEPDGHNFSGFHIRGKDFGHLILFRDVTDTSVHTFEVKGLTAVTKLTQIRSNTDCAATPSADCVTVSFGKERAYCWLRYEL